MILYGWGTKIKKLCFIGQYYCPSCGVFQNHYVMKRVFRITIFFLPIFWWTKGYYVVCDICANGKKITRQEADELVQTNQEMYREEVLEQIKRDAIAQLQEEFIEPAELFTMMSEKYALTHHIAYIKGFMEDICTVYGKQKMKEHSSK